MGAYVDYWKTWFPEHSKKNESKLPQNQSAPKTPPCKICCACPDERRVRDECIIRKASIAECETEIEAFYQCLAREGFDEESISKLRRSARL